MAFSTDVSVALKTIPAALRKLQPKGAAERFKLVFLLNVPKRRQIDGRRRHPLAPRGLGPTQAPHRPHGCDCPEMLGGGRREEAALQGAGRPSGERIGRQSALIYAYGYICTAHGTMW